MEPHDSLVQQLVSEAWLRIDRYDDELHCSVEKLHVLNVNVFISFQVTNEFAVQVCNLSK